MELAIQKHVSPSLRIRFYLFLVQARTFYFLTRFDFTRNSFDFFTFRDLTRIFVVCFEFEFFGGYRRRLQRRAAGGVRGRRGDCGGRGNGGGQDGGNRGGLNGIN